MLNNSIASRKSDNNQNGARPIGDLTGTKKFRGTVGIGDKSDFYSFTLTSRSSFNLSLNKLRNNVDVFLQQGKQTIARSTRGGKKPEAIATTLEAGTYFVRVNQKSGNSKYRLTLNATPTDPGGTVPPPPPLGNRFLSLDNGIVRFDPNIGAMSILYKRDPAQVPEEFTDIAVLGNEVFASTATGLYKIDANTGTPSFIGNLSGNKMRGLGFTPSGDLYGVGNLAGTTTPGLFLINKTNGTTLTVPLTIASNISDLESINDIAYDNTSGRFIGSGFLESTISGTDFFTIGLAGDITYRFNDSLTYTGGLTFDNGRLFVFSGGNNQQEFNPVTGDEINTGDRSLRFEPLQPVFFLGGISGAA
jgi:hypothetical protein